MNFLEFDTLVKKRHPEMHDIVVEQLQKLESVDQLSYYIMFIFGLTMNRETSLTEILKCLDDGGKEKYDEWITKYNYIKL